jgi:antibiotic biosynthesis monooxygenase (ABM) superfamily enzyme
VSDALTADPVEAAADPVTFVMSRRVKPGRDADFETWLTDVTAAAEAFPGSDGVTIIRPRHAGGEYVLIGRWKSYADLERWTASDERAGWLLRADELSVGPATTMAETGLEAWFSLPGETLMKPPKRWKQVLVTWLVLAPLIVVLSELLAPQLTSLHPILGTYLFTGVSTVVMAYLLMPLVLRVLRPWLMR